jgi:hypothetical protein
MIHDANHFLEHFAAIAGNYKWQILGHNICAFKKYNYYDPLTALTEVTRGEYVPKHMLEDAANKLKLTNHTYTVIFKVLYDHSNTDTKILKLREELKRICGLKVT